MILDYTNNSGHVRLWLLAVLTAALTGFYMFRLIFMTFHGEPRLEPERLAHVHESPPVMTVPLVILAVLSIVGGWVALPEGVLWGNAFGRFLAPVVGEFRPAIETSALGLSVVATVASMAGIALAWLLYIRLPGLPMLLAYRAGALYDLLLNKFFIDQLYDLIVTRPLFWISTYVLFRTVDSFGIDGAVDGAGLTVETGGELARRAETGNVQSYAFVYLLGAVAIVAYYVYRVMH